MNASLLAVIDRKPAQFDASARWNAQRALLAAFTHWDAHRWLLLKVLLRSLFSLALAASLVVYSVKYYQRPGNPSGVLPTAAAARHCCSSPIAEEPGEVRPFRSQSMSITEGRKESAKEYDANFGYTEIGAATPGSFYQARRKPGTGRRSMVDLFSTIFQDLLDEGLLETDHKVLCLGGHASEEVTALKERGVTKSIGVDRTQESRLKLQFADEIFDFEFSAEFDNVIHPALFVSEIERTLKVGGSAAMHVSLATWRERFMSSDFAHEIKPVTLLFRHSKIVYVSTAHAPGLDTVIVFKKNPISRIDGTSASNKRKSDDYALPEAAAVESVVNIEGMKSRPIPDIAQPLKHDLHVYVDIGPRGWGHCISSWFERQNPKITDNELSACIERDGPAQQNYAFNSQRYSLYAAWTTNRGVVISENYSFQHHNSEDEAMDMMIVEGVDFIDWLNKTVVTDDFVVINMYGEGTNLDLMYRMLETGTISLIDEVFLVCQQRNSWKDIIFLGAHHQRSYTECSTFYEMLHNSGVVVHELKLSYQLSIGGWPFVAMASSK